MKFGYRAARLQSVETCPKSDLYHEIADEPIAPPTELPASCEASPASLATFAHTPMGIPSSLSRQPTFSRRRFFRLCGSGLGAAMLAMRWPKESWAGTADQPVEMPKPPQPGYLESYTDPVFGSQITRITGDPGTPIPNLDAKWDVVARHHYSKNAAWNCDGSLLCLARHHGFPSVLFLDGRTYQPLFGRNDTPGAEDRWHPAKPDTMVYVKDSAIGLWNVRENKAEVLATFKDYAKLHIGPWEGNLSRDGRLIVVTGAKAGKPVAFAYDLILGKKWPDLDLGGIDVDWASVSASGRFAVVNGRFNSTKGDQTQVYDLDAKKIGELWPEYGRPTHYDLTFDENGDDIAVGVSKSKPNDGRIIKRRLRDGKVTVLTSGGYASHTSARNVKRPGWVYVTYQHRGPTWPPYWDEVVAVKLDGSMTVERIAHMHTKGTDYLSEAHAVPSPDGKRVLWASNWELPSGRPVGAYVAEGWKGGGA